MNFLGNIMRFQTTPKGSPGTDGVIPKSRIRTTEEAACAPAWWALLIGASWVSLLLATDCSGAHAVSLSPEEIAKKIYTTLKLKQPTLDPVKRTGYFRLDRHKNVNEGIKADDRLLDRQARAPGHPRAIVWLRLAAWDS